MGVAFLGYVLVWGQMSLWGATVITNLISAVPYVGNVLVLWMWGGFSLSSATLSFFFTLHFVLPFVMAVVIFAHLLMLHEVSRRSSVMIRASCRKIKFNPFFSLKDVLNICLLWLLYGLSFVSP